MKKHLNKFIHLTIAFILFCFSCSPEKSPQHYFSLAVNELKTEKYDNAYEFFSKAIELDSTYGQAYFMRAQVLGLLQASKDSICEDLKIAEELGYKEAKEVREQYCREIPIQEFNKLKTNFDSYIETNPDRFEGYYDRANLFFDIGEYKKAIEDYSRAIRRQEYPVIYYNRGLCYIQLGMKQEGCRDLRKSAELGYAVTREQLEFCN